MEEEKLTSRINRNQEQRLFKQRYEEKQREEAQKRAKQERLANKKVSMSTKPSIDIYKLMLILLAVGSLRNRIWWSLKQNMGQVTELRLSCYLVLLSTEWTDSKTR